MTIKTKALISLLSGAVCLLAACASAPVAASGSDLRGSWRYTLTDANRNTYDSGTVLLQGEPDRGTWRSSNFYAIEYRGDWKYEAGVLSLSGGENWQGRLSKPGLIVGSWENSNGEKGSLSMSR